LAAGLQIQRSGAGSFQQSGMPFQAPTIINPDGTNDGDLVDFIPLSNGVVIFYSIQVTLLPIE
jgi:hypothetical protein